MKIFTTTFTTTFTTLALFILMLLAQPVLAFQDSWIRGEILEVDPAARTLQIEVLEAGDEVPAEVGAIESYYVPRDIPVEYEIDSDIYAPYAGLEFPELRRGDRVLMDFDDVVKRSEIRTVRVTTTDVEVVDRIRREGQRIDDPERATERATAQQYAAEDDTARRSVLPDSGSALPLFALIGLLCAGLAATVRLYRS